MKLVVAFLIWLSCVIWVAREGGFELPPPEEEDRDDEATFV